MAPSAAPNVPSVSAALQGMAVAHIKTDSGTYASCYQKCIQLFLKEYTAAINDVIYI